MYHYQLWSLVLRGRPRRPLLPRGLLLFFRERYIHSCICIYIYIYICIYKQRDRDRDRDIDIDILKSDRLNWGAGGRGGGANIKSCYQKLCFMSKMISEFITFITGFVVGLPPMCQTPIKHCPIFLVLLFLFVCSARGGLLGNLQGILARTHGTLHGDGPRICMYVCMYVCLYYHQQQYG